MTIIRTTINPAEEIDVDDAELAALTAQGLVLDSAATTDAGAERAAVKQTAGKPSPVATEKG